MRRILRLISLLIALTITVIACEPTPSTYTSNGAEGGAGDSSNGGDNLGDNHGDSGGSSDNTFVTIAALKSLHNGATTRITAPLSIKGVVVANDIRGEYSDVIVVDDGSSAIEIYISNDPLHYHYPLGSTIVCRCEDLYIGSSYGVLRLGVKSADVADVVGLIEGDMLRCIYFSGEAAVPIPKSVTISDLSSALVSRYVRFEALTFEDVGNSFCDIDSNSGQFISTCHMLRDGEGHEIELYVPRGVEYAMMAIPGGLVNINGILTPYSEGCYGLRQIDYGID